MRLYTTKIPVIAREVIEQLSAEGDIETSNREEAELDIQAVLKEYLRMDREITEKVKDIMEKRNLPHDHFGKIKRSVSEEKSFGLGEDGVLWICNQILETFMQSRFIEEIFASDSDMRKKMKVIIRRNMLVDEELDGEVRNRIKNLQEGTTNWDVEYAKVMEQIKQKRGIKD